MSVIKAGIHKMNVRIANREDPDKSLILVCTVCLGLFERQLVLSHIYSLELKGRIDKTLII